MNLLPDLERAVIPLEKLAGYALNDQHPEGKHKARVFRVLLGIEGRHASVLAELIRSTLPKAPARTLETNEFGEKWTTHHRIVGLNAQSAIVTVGWIVRKDTGEPTLASCYIESNQQERLQRLFDSE